MTSLLNVMSYLQTLDYRLNTIRHKQSKFEYKCFDVPHCD